MKRPRSAFLFASLLAAGSALAQTGSVNTSGVNTSGVYIETTSTSFPDVGIEVIDSLRLFNASNQGLLRVYADGRVGVNTSTSERFHVFDNADRNSLIVVDNPNAGLSAVAGFRAKADVAYGSFHAHAQARTIARYGQTLGGWMEILQVVGNGLAIGTITDAPILLGTANAERLRILGNGNVGINKMVPAAKLHVGGDVIVDGTLTGTNVRAQYQDVAEWVVSDEQLSAGTVVIVAPGKNDQVVASTQPYDTRVAGVVSAQPGVILGVPGESKLMVATTGRVRVRIDATTAAIEAGDIIVTSAKPGLAMKSQPINVAGVKLHRPGTVVGKALEPLASGTGEILVLLSLQ